MLKSELFQQSYCIFTSEVNQKVLDHIQSLKIPSMKVLKALFENKLFCIVIPGHYPFKNIETPLFKIYREELPQSGFWGQYGMGYLGKEWSIVD